jgi:hypothetical protein
MIFLIKAMVYFVPIRRPPAIRLVAPGSIPFIKHATAAGYHYDSVSDYQLYAVDKGHDTRRGQLFDCRDGPLTN